MTFSKELLSLSFLLSVFPLRHASPNPIKCTYSLTSSPTCGPSEVPIHFPLCDHNGFDLYCNNLDRSTVLNLPMSGPFLVKDINYLKQQITIHDPGKCLARRLLTFNVSGSPFSSIYDVEYTFFTCPNGTVLPHSYRPVPCLSNSTSTFFTTTDFNETESMFRSCQIVKRLLVPAPSPLEVIDFSRPNYGYFYNQTLLLQWHSPNCTSCEVKGLRCAFKNKASLQVKCVAAKSGSLSSIEIVTIICASIVGGIIFFNICCACIRCCIYRDTSSSIDPRRQILDPRELREAIMRVVNQTIIDSYTDTSSSVDPRGHMVESREVRGTPTRGLDQSTIDSYKKMQLGESRRLPGTNGSVCPICLSEYESNDTVRFIPECDHCFHVECIDVWLKINGSCPLCQNSNSRA